ncbi:hypothetical protein JVX93_03735 [Mycolicibacterium boenickei]|nr:hypothetical protein JVX93_03735 [Mycolicibacterium boenickei]
MCAITANPLRANRIPPTGRGEPSRPPPAAALRDRRQPHWQVVFAVANRDESAALAEKLGATVVSSSDTEWTNTALIKDPQGAPLVLSQFIPPTG